MDSDLNEAKLRAEIAKLEAETVAIRKGFWTKVSDFLKILGVVTATAAAAYAAVTTYRITQLETRIALAEKQQAESTRLAALRARDNALNQLRSSVAARHQAERDATVAAKQLAVVREQKLDADRQRDGAVLKLAAERQATEKAVRHRLEAERQLADLAPKVANLRAEFATFEARHAIDVDPDAIKELRSKAAELEKSLQGAAPMLASFRTAAVTFPREITDAEFQSLFEPLFLHGVMLMPTIPSKIQGRAYTAVRYFKPEDQKFATAVVEILRPLGLTSAYTEIADPETALKPILTSGIFGKKPEIEVRFGADLSLLHHTP